MRKVHIRGSTLVILSYFCFVVYLLRQLIEFVQRNTFDSYYSLILFLGLFLFVLGKWKSRRDQRAQDEKGDKSLDNHPFAVGWDTLALVHGDIA